MAGSPGDEAARLVLVDTNVIAYAYDAGEAERRARAILLLEALRGTGRACVSAQVLSELYVTLRRKVEPPLSPREAETAISDLAVGWPVVPVTAATVRAAAMATRRHRLHFWDAMVWAAAKGASVDVVLSEDFQHGRSIEGVLFLNPFREDFELPPAGTW